MLTITTGSKTVIANVAQPGQANTQDDGDGDEIAQAKANVASTMEAITAAEQEHERTQAMQSAATSSENAKALTKKAFSDSGKANDHAIARIAHSDAGATYKKMAAKSSGNDLATRAKAQKIADYHQEMVGRHETMSSVGRNTLNTGSGQVVANVFLPSDRKSHDDGVGLDQTADGELSRGAQGISQADEVLPKPKKLKGKKKPGSVGAVETGATAL